MIYVDLESLLEKTSCQINSEQSYTDKKKLSIHLQVTHCLQIVHLMQQKTSSIVTEGKTVWKDLVRI